MPEWLNLYVFFASPLFLIAWSKPSFYLKEAKKLWLLLIAASCSVFIWTSVINVVHLDLISLDLPVDAHEKVSAYIKKFDIPTKFLFLPGFLLLVNFFLEWFSDKLIEHGKSKDIPPV